MVFEACGVEANRAYSGVGTGAALRAWVFVEGTGGDGTEALSWVASEVFFRNSVFI